MKTIKFLVLILTIILTSCSKDEDNEIRNDMIIGKWQLSKSGNNENGTYADSSNECDRLSTYTFSNKGSVIISSFYEDDTEVCAEWKIFDGAEYVGTWQKNSDNNYTFEFWSKDGSYGAEWFVSITFPNENTMYFYDGENYREEYLRLE